MTRHLFWPKPDRQWRAVGGTPAGDALRTRPGHLTQQISSVALWTEQTTVHNLAVAEHHTFYVLAGGTPLLLHNEPYARPLSYWG
jgi:hypothetical protein